MDEEAKAAVMEEYEAAFGRATQLIELGRDREAMETLHRMQRDFPWFEGLTQTLLAHAHASAGRRRQALEAARRAVAAAPDHPGTHYTLADALLVAGRAEDALLAADEAVGLDPDWSDAHQVRAKILSRLDRHADAFAAADEGLRLAPEDPHAHFTMGYVLHGNTPAEAIRAYEATLALDPQHSLALHNLSSLKLMSGDVDGGVRGYADVLATSPQSKLTVAVLDQLVVRVIRNLQVLALVAILLAGLVQADQGRTTWTAALPVVLIAVGAPLIIRHDIGPIRRELPRSGTGLLRGFVRRERLAVAWGLVSVAATVLVVVASLLTLTGGYPAALAAAVRPTLFLISVGVVVSWIREPLLKRRIERAQGS